MSPLSRSGAECQASSSRQRTVPSTTPLSGMALAGVPALTGPQTPPGQPRGHLGDDLAEAVHQVRGQVRPGGVAAGAGHPDLDLVAGGGDRTRADAELAGVEARVAVQGKYPPDRGEAARREHVD